MIIAELQTYNEYKQLLVHSNYIGLAANFYTGRSFTGDLIFITYTNGTDSKC